jgi:hypothetical protein
MEDMARKKYPEDADAENVEEETFQEETFQEEISSFDVPAPELKETVTPPPKVFRVLNKTIQTLYISIPKKTLVLTPGNNADLPEEYVNNNHHLKVMIKRGHVALFEY